MTKRSSIFLVLTIGSVLILSAAMLVIIWRLGFLSFSGTDPSSKVVAAALALVGTWVGAVVSVVGVLLKHSIDKRTESREWEAEQRLKLEAATRALQLFSTSSGNPTPEIQRDGALFTLSSLDQHKLTLALVSDLLRKKELDAGTASSLLDRAIRRGDSNDQIRAIEVLDNNAARMVTDEGLELPECIENWSPELSDYVREWAPIALGKIIQARSIREWSTKYCNDFPVIIAALAIAWETESNKELKNDTGAILRGILNAFPNEDTLWHPRMRINLVQIRKDVANRVPVRNAAANVVESLVQWSKQDTPPNLGEARSNNSFNRTRK